MPKKMSKVPLMGSLLTLVGALSELVLLEVELRERELPLEVDLPVCPLD